MAKMDETESRSVMSGKTRQVNFAESFDAVEWAKAYVQYVEENPSIATDEATMTGWFANALMRGYDERSREVRKKTLWVRISDWRRDRRLNKIIAGARKRYAGEIANA